MDVSLRSIAKSGLSRLMDLPTADRVIDSVQRLRMPFVRALNYHDVPPEDAARFEEHLRYYVAHYVCVAEADLVGLLAGQWPHAKPGLLLSFDDGLRSHAEVVKPLLEQYGISGWFFVPIGFVDSPESDQQGFAQRHRIDCFEARPGRLALTWEQVRDLDRRHTVGCHTWDHHRLSGEVDFVREIRDAKAKLELELGHAVSDFCWVGGEEASYSRAAAQMIRDAGFERSFMSSSSPIRPGSNPLQLQRTNVESGYELALVRLLLSGVADLWHARRRRRVNRQTAV